LRDDLLFILFKGFPYDRSQSSLKYNLANLNSILENCREVRRSGAASLDITSVASGRLDIYFEDGVKIWDFSAGIFFQFISI
jgi:myo-inositol-1(or 4)-monophosphatase